jgi:phospholipid-transporting ATPase
MIGISIELYGSDWAVYTAGVFWFGIFFLPFAINLRDFVWKYIKRTYLPQPYHIVQEVQKFNIPDYRPRQEWFKKAVQKVRQIQRIKQSRGYAFSQNESGQSDLIRSYDTTKKKPKG